VSDIEARLGGESRTLRTVTALAAERPGDRFSLVIGSDLEAETSSWYGAAELRRLVSFIVIGRAGHPGTGEAAEVAMPRVSSTEVRERLRRGEAVDDLVPRSVLAYIKARKLYGGT
jgi:nicotinate-nucleotide adenylyltransferase